MQSENTGSIPSPRLFRNSAEKQASDESRRRGTIGAFAF